MPNGRPGDHPLIDITRHGIRTFSEKADETIKQMTMLAPFADWWEFLYCMYRYEADDSIRIAGSSIQINIRDFERNLDRLLKEIEKTIKTQESPESHINKLLKDERESLLRGR